MQKALAPKEKLELVTEEGLQQGVDNIKGFLGKKWKSILDMFTWGGVTMRPLAAMAMETETMTVTEQIQTLTEQPRKSLQG